MKKTIFILALVLSLLPLGAVYHKVGDFDTLGTANDVEIVGNIAYVTDGDAGLVILDVSNPQNPTLLGSYDTPGYANAVAVDSGIACVTDGELRIIDVSNPQNPVLLSSYVTSGNASSVELCDSIAYVASRYSLYLIDISNPQNPSQLSSYYANGYQVESVRVGEDKAYIIAVPFLVILDVSNPQNPTYLGSIFGSCIGSLAVEDGIAYTGAGVEMWLALVVIDVSDPQNPVQIASYDDYYATSIAVVDSMVYLANGSEIKVLNFSNPQNPILISSYNTPGGVNNITITDNIAYIADGLFGVQIIDVSNPENSSLLSTYSTPIQGEALCVAIADSMAYVGYHDWNFVAINAALLIINVSNPQNPVLLSNCSSSLWPNSVAVMNEFNYVAVGDGLQVFDVSDPLNPSSLGLCPTPGYADYVTLAGGTAYVADGDLRIIDVSNPQNISLIGSYNTWGSASSVAVVNSLAYLAAGSAGLQVIDVSNPLNTSLLSSYATAGDAISISVADNVAFVAEGEAGLQIINVSNPSSPSLISTILPHATSNINLISIHNSQLFVSDLNWNEISIYDIVTPQFPILVSRYAWNLHTADMCSSNTILYTVNYGSILNIHDITTFPVQVDDETQIPVTSFQMRNYPNPFNPETTISYTLPAKGQVCLEIYNSKGQLVKRLLNEPQAKGEHSLTWNGKDNSGQSVASGLYLCRITSDGKHESRKLLLLK